MRHGAAVQVDYIDLAEDEARTTYAPVLALIQERGLPYPLVAINGTLRLAGTAQFYQVAPLVEEALRDSQPPDPALPAAE